MIQFPDGTEFVKLWCVFNIDYLCERQSELRALQSELDSMKSDLVDQKVQMNQETDNQRRESMKKKTGEMQEDIHKMEEKVEKSRWFNKQEDYTNPWIPEKERRDIQPGVEIDYVYHRENDFIPMGMSAVWDNNGNFSARVTPFPQNLP